MIIKKESSVQHYGAWNGARDLVNRLTPDEVITIDNWINEEFPDGINETHLNDILWFADDFIIEVVLGYGEEGFDEFWDR